MIYTPTQLEGVWLVEPERHSDDRGFFARTWCSREFETRGLNSSLVQSNVSFNRRRGTLRGMHLQRAPWGECKLVRCTQGAIFDVVLDLRPNSVTYCQWVGTELTSDNHKAFYIPEGCAHGFQTLTETSEVLYQMSQYFVPESATGVRWNDPVFSIQWPETEVRHLSPRDATYPDFHDVRLS
ncbi:MAG: dTDP-4-dehydrorhamnose 3,5-epimerase [Planctomyces sp.]|nr:dTDP-4-dehydrorhamnose 3,5-epimerase [Planctomyces sp.]